MPFVTQDDIDEKEKRRPAPGSTDALVQSWKKPEPTAQLVPLKPSGTPARDTPSNGGTNQSPSAMPTIQRDQPASIREMPLTPQPGMDTRPPVSSIMPSIVSTPPPTPSSGRSPLHIIGEIGRGVGSALGQVVAPWAMPFIPGTVQHQWLEQGQERSKERFADEEAASKARTGLEQAQTEAEKAKTAELGRMPAGREPTEAGLEKDERDAWLQANPGKTAADWLSYKESLKQSRPEGKVEPLGAEGKEYVVSPSGEAKAVMVPAEGAPDLGTARVTPELFAGGDRGMTQAVAPQKPTKEPTEKPVAGSIGGKPAWGKYMETGWVDPATGQTLQGFVPPPSFAETGLFEPTEVNVGGTIKPGKFDRRTGTVSVSDVAGGAATVVPPRTQGELNKIMDTARGADTRYGVMIDNEQPALAGNQQAMINILANHMGMTQGLQKGSRINQAMWDEANASAPWLDRALSRFTVTDPATGDRVINQPLSGITLTPSQIKQMVELGQDRRMREWQQVLHTGQQNGIDVSNEIPQDLRGAINKVEGKTGPPAGGGGKEIHYKIVGGKLVKQ